MHKTPLLFLILVALAGCPVAEPEWPDPTPIHGEVDVFVGTGGAAFAVGSAFPGPALPFGMVRPGPDTQGASSTMGALHCSGYRAADGFVAGFSHLREHGTGVPDFGAILLVPATSLHEGKRVEAGYRLPKGTETGRPGYYSVELEVDEGVVLAELTTAARAGAHRYTYPAGAQAGVILDVTHVLPDVDYTGGELVLEQASGQRISGWMHLDGPYTGRHGGEDVYFAIRFNAEPASVQTWDEGEDLGAWFTFDGDQVGIQVGISFVDVAGAWNNLEVDIGDRAFDEVLAAAEAAWVEALSSFALGGGGEEERAIFASSAYHSMLMPTLFTDADGRYWGFDDQVHTADGWTFYTDFSLWDTYRTLHPLMNLVEPERQGDFLRSLLAMYDQVGRVPRWPMGSGTTGGMVGDPHAVLFADALIRGIGSDAVDGDEALAALLDTAEQRGVAWEAMNDRGWIAVDEEDGSVAKTLEYAWADGAIAELAALLGEAEVEASARARSTGWRPLFDPETGFIRGRWSDGSWVEPFDSELFDDVYVEGSAWHYTFMTPLDLPGARRGLRLRRGAAGEAGAVLRGGLLRGVPGRQLLLLARQRAGAPLGLPVRPAGRARAERGVEPLGGGPPLRPGPRRAPRQRRRGHDGCLVRLLGVGAVPDRGDPRLRADGAAVPGGPHAVGGRRAGAQAGGGGAGGADHGGRAGARRSDAVLERDRGRSGDRLLAGGGLS